MPLGFGELEPDLHDAAVSALDLAAGGAPALLPVLLVGDGVAVALEVVGLEPQRVAARTLGGLPELGHDFECSAGLQAVERRGRSRMNRNEHA